jgi:hypothetical protein
MSAAPAEVLDLAVVLKRENPARTAAGVRRILRAQLGWAPDERTLCRHFARLGLMGAAVPDAPAIFGRFEASRPNELWTGEALHQVRFLTPVDDRLLHLDRGADRAVTRSPGPGQQAGLALGSPRVGGRQSPSGIGSRGTFCSVPSRTPTAGARRSCSRSTTCAPRSRTRRCRAGRLRSGWVGGRQRAMDHRGPAANRVDQPQFGRRAAPGPNVMTGTPAASFHGAS